MMANISQERGELGFESIFDNLYEEIEIWPFIAVRDKIEKKISKHSI